MGHEHITIFVFQPNVPSSFVLSSLISLLFLYFLHSFAFAQGHAYIHPIYNNSEVSLPYRATQGEGM